MIPASSLVYFSPAVLLTALAMALLMAEAFLSLSARVVTYWALGGLAALGIYTLAIDGHTGLLWYHLARWDGDAKFFHLFFIVVAAFVIWMGDEVQDPMEQNGGEFVILPLFTTAGLMLLSMANDFMLLFVALELVTISFYILVAYQRRSPTALEAGVKYLILGGVSSAFMVMGIAYIFGLTGSTRFDEIIYQLQGHLPTGVGFGLLLVLIGVGFKIAMVPFHIWAPDVYEGAPTSITAFLSVGSKAGGLIILLRIVLGVFGPPEAVAVWMPLLSIGAILSLVLGNLAAIPQRNMKRLLGYSSIGHTGFILVAVIAAATTLPGRVTLNSGDPASGQVAVGIYLVTYLLATFTSFIVLAVLSRRRIGMEVHHLAGLSQRSPLLAAALALSLVSLAGVPPLSGFMAKFMVVLVAWNRHLYLLLFFTIFAAVAALYYYLGPIKAMYWSEPLDHTPIKLNRVTRVVLVILVFLLITTGFWPQPLFVCVRHALISGAPGLHASAEPASPPTAILSQALP